MTRQNSIIQQLHCKQCGDRIVAKVGGGKQWRDNDRVQLQKEYATLRILHSAFLHEEGLGTLQPLGYLEAAGRGILVTRWCMGTELVRYAHGSDASALEQAFRLAGAWLLKLHDAENKERPPRSLGIAEKIEDLLRTYGGVLRAQARAWQACELLAGSGQGLEALTVRSVRIHGDFKPQNMLYDDTRCVGLDIQWNAIGAAVYDLAPFLNHLWLAGAGKHGLHARMRYLQAEAAFLAGYGEAAPSRALRWAQLYFALCYLGGYRQRGTLAVVYANWKIWPLIRRLEGQLRETA
jgi:Ser/Thr protein kinase RdoA (MazF antagonist)